MAIQYTIVNYKNYIQEMLNDKVNSLVSEMDIYRGNTGKDKENNMFEV